MPYLVSQGICEVQFAKCSENRVPWKREVLRISLGY